MSSATSSRRGAVGLGGPARLRLLLLDTHVCHLANFAWDQVANWSGIRSTTESLEWDSRTWTGAPDGYRLVCL